MLAGVLFFFHREYTFSEAVSYGIICTFLTFSLIFQIAFIIGFPDVSFIFEVLLSGAALIVVWKLSRYFPKIFKILKFVSVRHPIAFPVLLLVFMCLAFQAVSMSGVGDYQFLDQLKQFEKEGTFFITSNSAMALVPVNAKILSHFFLRFGASDAAGFLGFFAYLSIGFSTYALSRRYAWPPTAFTVTLITLSLPRFVFLATGPGDELIPAASALFCILATYRLLELPEIQDLILLILGILFEISGSLLCLALPLILAALSCILFIRRHGKTTGIALMLNNRKVFCIGMLPAVVFSQIWLFLYNIWTSGGWLGQGQSYFPLNVNVLVGALANMIRYLFESIHLTLPVDQLLQRLFGFSIQSTLQNIYSFIFIPLFGSKGAAAPFVITWIPDGIFSWFGPFGFLMVIPAIIWAMIRGHRRMKAIAVAFLGYFYIVSLVAAWMPGNARFFTPIFACGGFCVSYLLPPWRFTRTGKYLFQIISILLLIYACLFNMDKPMIKIFGCFFCT
jgi:hypothetical protein